MSFFGAPQTDTRDNSPIKASVDLNTPIASTSVKNQSATVIAGGVRLEGEFKSQGDVQIEGEVVGTLETNATLSVGANAKVKAGVKAENAVIAGEIIGNVIIADRLELKTTAKIVGEIICETIVVEAGAVIEGNLKCGAKKDTGAIKQDSPTSKNDNIAKSSQSEIKSS